MLVKPGPVHTESEGEQMLFVQYTQKKDVHQVLQIPIEFNIIGKDR